MSKNKYDGIDQYLVKQVRYRARSLLFHSSIYGVEIEDLEQEMMLDFFSRCRSYDPGRSKWSTFIDRILRHKCASLIEAARAQKRRLGMPAYSLNTLMEGLDGMVDEFPDPASENHSARDLFIDLKHATRDMPRHLVVLLVDLRTLNMSEISRKTKTPRATLYDTLFELRSSLRAMGVVEYLH